MSIKKAGFTIVELLIVVVVIGILAAITIVAYSGFQVRAENAKTVAAVQAYRKALTQYATEKGSYPYGGGFCLGDQYVALAGATTGCRQSNSIITTAQSTAYFYLLAPYLGNSLPSPSLKLLSNGAGVNFVGTYFYGPSYNYTLDGEKVVALVYTIEDTVCPIGPVYTGAPTYTSPAIARTAAISTTASVCHLLLPDASRL